MATQPIKTVAGNWYCFTCTAPATVTAEIDGESVTLAKLGEGGTAVICSPSATVTVETEGKYRLLPTKAPAAASASNSSGGAIQEQIATAINTALCDKVPTRLATAEGEGLANLQWAELDACHIPEGELESIEITARTNGNPSTFSYLGIWEQEEDATTWRYLGSSRNAPGQGGGRASVWEFASGIHLAGRRVRLLAQDTPGPEWKATRAIGAKVTSPLPEGDTSSVAYGGRQYAFLLRMAVNCKKAVPKYAPASHVGDPTHLQENGRVLRLHGASGQTLLVMRGNETNVTITGNQLTFNVPQLLVSSSCAAIYKYDTATDAVAVWFAGTDTSQTLAPLGIPNLGTNIGAEAYPLSLHGSELNINGTQIDTSALRQLLERKEELLALLEAGQTPQATPTEQETAG